MTTMTTRAMRLVALAAVLAGCSVSGPCPGSECRQIGWWVDHYTCVCAPPVVVVPAPAPVVAAAPPSEKFVINYRASHPCLTAETRRGIDRAVDFMKAHPDLKAHVVGFADAREPAARIDWIANRRAYVVRKYMIRRGIAADRITAEGHGAAEPVAGEQTEASRAENRRVEITVQ